MLALGFSQIQHIKQKGMSKTKRQLENAIMPEHISTSAPQALGLLRLIKILTLRGFVHKSWNWRGKWTIILKISKLTLRKRSTYVLQ